MANFYFTIDGQRKADTQTLLASQFVLALSTTAHFVDRVVCVLLHKSKAIN
jgi:hypothetical protein